MRRKRKKPPKTPKRECNRVEYVDDLVQGLFAMTMLLWRFD